ncbi:MAG: DUF2066 domain-containing protein [Gammaproteobacteria bacterium]
MEFQKLTAGFVYTLLGLLLCAVLPAHGAQDLFESEIAVSDQTPGVRTEAFRTALARTIVRVSGDQSVLTGEPASALLADPARLVQQYRYFTEASTSPPTLKLWVRFDGDAIRRSLQTQGMSYWGGERPDTLVWLAVEDRGQRYIVSADGSSDVHNQIQLAARQRGVPILFPLMDLEDQSQVRFSDLWGGFFDKVLSASKRYRPPAVLIGRLNRSPSGGWSSRWYLDVVGRTNEWTDSHQQLRELARQGVEDVADILATRFAVTGSDRNGRFVNITVNGIETLAAYARISQYLGSLSSVSKVEVGELTPGGVQYALQVSGSLEDLTRTVSIGSIIEPEPGGLPGSFRLRQ